MITGTQIRAARSSLRWTVLELAGAANLSVSSIKRVEGDDQVPSISAKSLAALKAALETEGIEFIGTPDNGPGIRVHRRSAP